jgi:phosphoribosylformylglycinamidine synthase
MKAAVIVFPGSNCDRDVQTSLAASMGSAPDMVWHGDAELPKTDLIVVPGGFSYGDYLRCGAMAAHSPVMREVVKRAQGGTPVLGICNGFQVLTETGLLPGALMRNAGLNFVCREVRLEVVNSQSIFTSRYAAGETVTIPVAHHDGHYFADEDTLNRLEGEGRVAFRYAEPVNGSARAIAGILNDAGNVLGMMPHPERLIEDAQGGTDGRRMFEAVQAALGSGTEASGGQSLGKA